MEKNNIIIRAGVSVYGFFTVVALVLFGSAIVFCALSSLGYFNLFANLEIAIIIGLFLTGIAFFVAGIFALFYKYIISSDGITEFVRKKKTFIEWPEMKFELKCYNKLISFNAKEYSISDFEKLDEKKKKRLSNKMFFIATKNDADFEEEEKAINIRVSKKFIMAADKFAPEEFNRQLKEMLARMGKPQ